MHQFRDANSRQEIVDDDIDSVGSESDDDWTPRDVLNGFAGSSRREEAATPSGGEGVVKLEKAVSRGEDGPPVRSVMDRFDWDNSVLGPRACECCWSD